MHKIKSIIPGSVAHQLEIETGDELVKINGQNISDVLDYRFLIHDEEILLEIKKQNGDIWELDIEKDEAEDIGLVFEQDLMDNIRTCSNNCIFCFMHQLPKGLRKTLYIKDDDPRLSFLSGNYITLTNLDDKEARRIARYHLSPLHISVHAANLDLRRKILRNKKPDKLFEYLKLFKAAGITMHFQIVLCKGINDGAYLDETISALLEFNTGSLAVVPVGITKYRDGLYPLEPFNSEEAAAVTEQVNKWQEKAKIKMGTRFVFCADEWYINAGLSLPGYDYYEDFPQLENGVGMCALFEKEFNDGLKSGPGEYKSACTGIVTGTSAAAFINRLVGKVDPEIKVYPVCNDFFGSTVTTGGLLTGSDVINQVKPKATADKCKRIFLPGNMFRSGTDLTLDDVSLDEISGALGMAAVIGATNGEAFLKQLYYP